MLFGFNMKFQRAEEKSESIGTSLIILKFIFLNAEAFISIFGDTMAQWVGCVQVVSHYYDVIKCSMKLRF